MYFRFLVVIAVQNAQLFKLRLSFLFFNITLFRYTSWLHFIQHQKIYLEKIEIPSFCSIFSLRHRLLSWENTTDEMELATRIMEFHDFECVNIWWFYFISFRFIFFLIFLSIGRNGELENAIRQYSLHSKQLWNGEGHCCVLLMSNTNERYGWMDRWIE